MKELHKYEMGIKEKQTTLEIYENAHFLYVERREDKVFLVAEVDTHHPTVSVPIQVILLGDQIPLVWRFIGCTRHPETGDIWHYYVHEVYLSPKQFNRKMSDRE